MLYTKHGAVSIKKEIPCFVVREKDTLIDREPSRFQRNIKVKVEVPKYNLEAGKLPL
jgi:hypothetical protein